MWDEILDDDLRMFKFVPERFKTQEMCQKTVEKDPWMLDYTPDKFVNTDLIKIWQRNVSIWCIILGFGYNNREWHDRYIKRKAWKKNIKKELIPITWHPDRYWDWGVPEDEKKELETYFT